MTLLSRTDYDDVAMTSLPRRNHAVRDAKRLNALLVGVHVKADLNLLARGLLAGGSRLVRGYHGAPVCVLCDECVLISYEEAGVEHIFNGQHEALRVYNEGKEAKWLVSILFEASF